jgi:23S rRNA (pseudouridine1915-N3)-methyltransferase
MKIAVHAVGRMKAGPEQELVSRYFERFAKAGPPLGLEFAGITEIAEGRAQSVDARRDDEAERLQAGIGNSVLWMLDERGKNPTSADLARRMATLRDSGQKGLAIAIGGPDGHAEQSRSRADFILSFGALTWPHQMVRIMLAEQLYRAATILSGHPYHRA